MRHVLVGDEADLLVERSALFEDVCHQSVCQVTLNLRVVVVGEVQGIGLPVVEGLTHGHRRIGLAAIAPAVSTVVTQEAVGESQRDVDVGLLIVPRVDVDVDEPGRCPQLVENRHGRNQRRVHRTGQIDIDLLPDCLAVGTGRVVHVLLEQSGSSIKVEMRIRIGDRLRVPGAVLREHLRDRFRNPGTTQCLDDRFLVVGQGEATPDPNVVIRRDLCVEVSTAGVVALELIQGHTFQRPGITHCGLTPRLHRRGRTRS